MHRRTHTRIHGDGWWSICFSPSSIQLVPFVGAFLHEMDDLVDCHICSLLAQILCSVCHSFPWPSCPTLQQTIRLVPLHIIIIIMISSIIACAIFPTVHRLEPHCRVATANLRNTVTTQMRVWVRLCRACVYLMVTSCSRHNRHSIARCKIHTNSMMLNDRRNNETAD